MTIPKARPCPTVNLALGQQPTDGPDVIMRTEGPEAGHHSPDGAVAVIMEDSEAFVRQTSRANSVLDTDEMFSQGFGVLGFTYVEALRIAAELPGGLTRTNFMLAVRSLQFNPGSFKHDR